MTNENNTEHLNEYIRNLERKKPSPNLPPVYITLEECPDCGMPVEEPVEGAEQKRTVTDIPLPEHIVYEVIF